MWCTQAKRSSTLSPPTLVLEDLLPQPQFTLKLLWSFSGPWLRGLILCCCCCYFCFWLAGFFSRCFHRALADDKEVSQLLVLNLKKKKKSIETSVKNKITNVSTCLFHFMKMSICCEKNQKIIFHLLSKTSTVAPDSTEALCSPLVERASLEQSSSADRPPASPFSSPGPSHISAPPGSALPGEYPENKMFLKSKHFAVQAITWSPNIMINWEF